ncbi:Aste57867_10366 [Aphanomyces stellatus]|uniref:Aste57867_10366 protein n=1 Tax=Aphanomyces stellatus TaxID=120398 RepID=A0A485KQ88_9STRA|nr:hypothetical protein As57867_010326 [Aphanomyces stellatus]VFT87240.1 Aste57867_10366 [Aphanomyces stellatus]
MLPPAVPLSVLFGNAEYAMPQISPDGRRVAFLTAGANGVMNIFLQDVDGGASPSQVTHEHVRPIRFFRWACTGSHLLYVQDLNGNERFHLHVVDLSSSTVTDLTPVPDAKVLTTFAMTSFYNHINRLTSSTRPLEVVVGLNTRTPTLFDVHRIHLETGETTLLADNPGHVDTWVIDRDLVVRAQIQLVPGDVWAKSLSVRDHDGDAWRVIATWGLDDSLDALDLTADGTGLYVKSTLPHGDSDTSPNPNKTARLLLLSTHDGRLLETVAAHADGDVDTVTFNPLTGAADLATVQCLGHEQLVLDARLQPDLEILAAVAAGAIEIVSRAADDRAWTVSIASDHTSKRYYHYNRTTQSATLLALERPLLDTFTFAPMQPVRIPCRDGESMVAYLTLPVGVPATDLPMVLNVHGGPWAHDVWGFNPIHQWFANRGYACLSVNYRGSDGYGMRWLNLGNQQWGGTMQDDLTDAVAWAVAAGYVDAVRVGIYGRSYGGYAVLAGLAFTPEIYACGVDVVGPSNIQTLLAATPPDWNHMKQVFAVRIGDTADEAVNRKMSPLFHVAAMTKPLLIGQGANDPRVAQAESDQIARELHHRNHDVTYIVYPDEGHGFSRPPNNIYFCQRTEEFLAAHLQGRVCPRDDAATAGHTAIVVDLAAL